MTKNKSQKKLELYFHIPFCVRKCLYCDFLSAPADEMTRNAYMEALVREVSDRAREYKDYIVDTVFIGGGTPSMVEGVWIERLMDAVRLFYALSPEAEVTIEVNPGTVTEEKLQAYKNAGINRMSIGLQSADDEELRNLGRIHTWAEFLESYGLVRAVGFQNVNVDIMSALPGQTIESFCSTLDKVLNLEPNPEHISAYSLIVEEGTPFARMYEKGQLTLPDEDCEREMYEVTARHLTKKGYHRYEISNYAKSGKECRHNCGYWRRIDYVGFGIGAASLVDNCRFVNESDLQKYLSNPLACRCKVEKLSVHEQMEEFMFLGLRMLEGVSVEAFRMCFGHDLEKIYGSVIEKNILDGLLYYVKIEDTDKQIALTEKGIAVSNYVMAQFLFD